MRILFLFIFSVLTVAAKGQSDLNQLKWLDGKWERTNVKPGRSGFEIWQTQSASEMMGRGISLKGVDTTFVEKLKIVREGGTLFYVSDVPENKQPVYFRITELSDHSFVSENPKHDFPKKIAYEWDGSQLKATISGDGKSIDFFFRRVN